MIHISQAAASEIKRMQMRQGADAKLRLAVSSGGCADLYYTIDFDKMPYANDRTFECGGIQVMVDEQSLNYIAGLTIDYSEDLMGGGFRFHNPNAISSCGCGNSFSVDAPAITEA